PHRDDVVSIHRNAGDAVSFGAIAQIIVGLHCIRSVPVRRIAIFHDEDDGQPLMGGQTGSFVPASEGSQAVVGEGNDDVRFFEVTSGESYSSGDIELPGDGCCLGNDAQFWYFSGRMRGKIFLLKVEQLGEHALEWSITDHVGGE